MMEAPDEIERKAREHGGWVERTIVALLAEIARLEGALRDATDETRSKEVGVDGKRAR